MYTLDSEIFYDYLQGEYFVTGNNSASASTVC